MTNSVFLLQGLGASSFLMQGRERKASRDEGGRLCPYAQLLGRCAAHDVARTLGTGGDLCVMSRNFDPCTRKGWSHDQKHSGPCGHKSRNATRHLPMCACCTVLRETQREALQLPTPAARLEAFLALPVPSATNSCWWWSDPVSLDLSFE